MMEVALDEVEAVAKIVLNLWDPQVLVQLVHLTVALQSWDSEVVEEKEG